MKQLLVLTLIGTLLACSGKGVSLIDADTDNNGRKDAGDNNSNDAGTNNIYFPSVDMGHFEPGPCVEGSEDQPDKFFFDSNCDGIDGDISKSVFVAIHGDDANAGTQRFPKRSIQAGIDEAKASGKTWVLVGDGTYVGQINLVDGISISGGFEFGWMRSNRVDTFVEGASPTILATGINTPTTLISLTVTPEVSERGQSTITIGVKDSSAVILKNLTLNGGTGSEGAMGESGTIGMGGLAGGNGGNAPDDSSGISCKNQDNQPVIGIAGLPSCGDIGTGGKGGRGAFQRETGQTGRASWGGTEGGAGGKSGLPGETGLTGETGMVGEPGKGASSEGRFNAFVWEAMIGTQGLVGGPAAGGGGGGGGGGGNDGSGCHSWGGAGGGGGSGGCGGSGGFGGGPGGASVVLFLINSPGITLMDCKLLSGQGGKGGLGGEGGPGGPGGAGGLGGRNEDNSGVGGAGGTGGAGGAGGSGGSGSGGPAFGIYSDLELLKTPDGTQVTKGIGGEGGDAPSDEARGETGIAEAIRIGSP